MSEDSTESDEAKRALDELYEDGRKPTLKELDEVIKKHGLKLVSIELPSGKKWEAESVQISQDEFEFYIKNRPLLAEVEKLKFETPSESAQIVRAMRDGR